MRFVTAGVIVVLLICGVSSAEEPIPVGDEFQVNSYTTSYQTEPSVAVADEGDFVVVWSSNGSYGTDTHVSSIQAQRYAADGAPAGGQFQVNSYTSFVQFLPAVAVEPQGSFVVVWVSYGSFGTDTDLWSIQAQRFLTDGTPAGGQFQVNTYTTGIQFRPAVAVEPQGSFVVVWDSNGSYGTDTDLWSIQAQRYDATGMALGSEFQVNTYTTSYQTEPSVAVADEGDFVVVWDSNGSYGTDTSEWSIQGQRFLTDGTPAGGQFQVNSYTTSSQRFPWVTADAQGDFVVVWESPGSFGTDSGKSIQAQRYDSSGTPLGGEFQVNTYTTSGQGFPAVTANAQGDFVVVWESLGSFGTDTDDRSIQAQRYDSSGTPLGGEFQVNTYTTSGQKEPSVSLGADGAFVVVWESEGSDGTDTDDRSIQGQRYSTPIFTDGFESGDTSAWSNSVP